MLSKEAYATDADWIASIEQEVEIEERSRLILEWIGESVPGARERHDRDRDWEHQAVLLADALLGLDDVARVLDQFAGPPGNPAPEVPQPETREARRPANDENVVPPPVTDRASLPIFLTIRDVAALMQRTPHAIRQILWRAKKGEKTLDGFPLPRRNLRWDRDEFLRWMDGPGAT